MAPCPQLNISTTLCHWPAKYFMKLAKSAFFPHLTSLEVRFHLHCVIIQSREQSDSCLQLANKREHKDTACYLIYIPESHNLGAHIHTLQTKKKTNSLLDVIPYASLPMTKRFSTHTHHHFLFLNHCLHFTLTSCQMQ